METNKKLSILIIEDSEDDALLVLHQIKKGGYDFDYIRVESAEEMRYALEKRDWDIVLSDFQLPHFNGLEALKLLKESHHDMPFVIVSGVIGEEVAVEAMKAGANDYIMKNNLQRLLPAVEREIREAKGRAERRLLEEKKRLAEERFSRIFRLSPIATAIIRVSDGKIVDVNEVFIRETGYSREEVIGRTSLDLNLYANPEDRDKILQLLQEKGILENYEFEFRNKSGEIRFGVHTTIVINLGGETHYLSLIQDITNRKLFERKILNAIITTEEKERSTFSQDLHDGLGPMLSTVKLYFEWLAETTETDKRAKIIGIGLQNINDAIQTVREISNRLSPRILNMGLIPAMKYLIHRLNETQKIKINMTADIERRYNPQIEVTLYRIFSELINNTIKYAQAHNVTIDITHKLDKERMFAVYTDDGKGFSLQEVLKSGKGMGIQNMQQRIETLNGNINFDTENGKPLTVKMELPINDII